MGSKESLDGNARHAIAHSSSIQANKCLAKWRPVLKSSWLLRMLRLNIVKTTIWQAFFSSVSTTVDAQRDKIASWSCENGGERDWSEEAAVDGNNLAVEILAQDWTSVDREK